MFSGIDKLDFPEGRGGQGPFGLQVWTWVCSILEVSLGVSLMHMCSSER